MPEILANWASGRNNFCNLNILFTSQKAKIIYFRESFGTDGQNQCGFVFQLTKSQKSTLRCEWSARFQGFRWDQPSDLCSVICILQMIIFAMRSILNSICAHSAEIHCKTAHKEGIEDRRLQSEKRHASVRCSCQVFCERQQQKWI